MNYRIICCILLPSLIHFSPVSATNFSLSIDLAENRSPIASKTFTFENNDVRIVEIPLTATNRSITDIGFHIGQTSSDAGSFVISNILLRRVGKDSIIEDFEHYRVGASLWADQSIIGVNKLWKSVPAWDGSRFDAVVTRGTLTQQFNCSFQTGAGQKVGSGIHLSLQSCSTYAFTAICFTVSIDKQTSIQTGSANPIAVHALNRAKSSELSFFLPDQQGLITASLFTVNGSLISRLETRQSGLVTWKLPGIPNGIYLFSLNGRVTSAPTRVVVCDGR